MQDKTFLRVAGICALITAITTIGVHYISFPNVTFEERLLLSENNLYIAHRWMIILHCICVVTSMLGLLLIRWTESRGFMVLGFVFYCVFSVTEITRMVAVLKYLLPLRQQYIGATNENVRFVLQQSIEQFNLVGNTLFTIFAIAFMLGNLCYGIVFSKSNTSDRWIGYAFLYWAATSMLGLSNEFFQMDLVGTIIEWNAKLFQPVFRGILGVWLWRKSGSFKNTQ